MVSLRYKKKYDITILAFYDIIIGSEVEVVPDMLLTGAFAHINSIMFDWSHGLAGERLNELLRKLKVLRLQNGP